MRGFTFGHPEERCRSQDDRATTGEELARSGRCYGRCLAVAAGPCVWLVARLHMLVVDEEIIVRAAVVGCLLCFLRVYLDAVP